MLMTANGTFHRWRFTRVDIDREHPERSVVEVEVDIASIDTGIERRDAHLRTADFFEVETWPTASVRITDASPDGESDAGTPRYRADFMIRIRDVEKTLPGTFEVVAEKPPRVEGELVLNRTDFGVGEPHRRWNPTSIREEIPVRFSVQIPED
jgi:polyisoprenoid-binding protein YceI